MAEDPSEEEEKREREMGIDLGELSERLDRHEYPATTDELVEEYGEYEIDYPNKSETLESVLGPIDDTYDSADSVRQEILNMVSSEAVGRERYSDRGGSTPEGGEEGEDEDVSF